ncbi:TRAP-type C4-dicarboxylate transporter, large permease component [Thiohalobacter thiocyanaticus]|uniref:TRAP-type C4-dicarboxylate transporter, large permease component n=1 Tax=Thiohalobacter thiocyanaticus TaxID=585455 RepID=A0A1Z4VNY6_9GAMM|nr:hypothetical protein [Thiohalobacter thiocyanaticus]BAZ93058.1 TRAP-type C4-dicarboxylate transporter, large permease component [Thiohalobacter thiocyanaticus]
MHPSMFYSSFHMGLSERVLPMKPAAVIVLSLVFAGCAGDATLQPGSGSSKAVLISFAAPMLRTRQYQGMRSGFDFIAYQLRAIALHGGERRHELHVQLTYSGLRRHYRHARLDAVGIEAFGMQVEEAVSCPEHRIGPPCDTRVRLTLPLNEALLRSRADAGLQIVLVAEDGRETALLLDPAYITAYLADAG